MLDQGCALRIVMFDALLLTTHALVCVCVCVCVCVFMDQVGMTKKREIMDEMIVDDGRDEG